MPMFERIYLPFRAWKGVRPFAPAASAPCCLPSYIRRRVFAVLFLCLCLASGGCIAYPELVEKGTKAPRAERCGECHIDIYREWKDSPHARSFTSAAFAEETNEYQFTFCLGCHAPETIFTDGKIEPRSVNRSEGVNCNSCHLDDCKLSGPTPAHGPHPIAGKNPFFRTSKLCGKCHTGTYLAWKESGPPENKKTCQDCHMPPINRKLIQDEPWQKIYPRREGKQHLFSYQALCGTSEPLLKASFAGVAHSEGKVEGVLEVENTGVPHGVPTGDYGYREVVITIEFMDEAGNIAEIKKERLFVEMKTALQSGEKRTVPFCFQGRGDTKMVLKAKMARASLNNEVDVVLAEAVCSQW